MVSWLLWSQADWTYVPVVLLNTCVAWVAYFTCPNFSRFICKLGSLQDLILKWLQDINEGLHIKRLALHKISAQYVLYCNYTAMFTSVTVVVMYKFIPQISEVSAVLLLY